MSAVNLRQVLILLMNLAMVNFVIFFLFYDFLIFVTKIWPQNPSMLPAPETHAAESKHINAVTTPPKGWVIHHLTF